VDDDELEVDRELEDKLESVVVLDEGGQQGVFVCG
jgi:hypothetical protein